MTAAPSDDLSPDVLTLLRDRVPGPYGLEMLLLMRSDPTRGWTISSLAPALGVPESWVEQSLDGLCATNLVVEDGSSTERQFFYHPATVELETAINELAQVYAERPADVVRTMNDSAIARVRSAAVQLFPTALMLRKDE